MFSTIFIEQAQNAMKEKNESTSAIVEFVSTFFIVSKVPLEEGSLDIFQGHIGEGENLLFVYLKVT